MKLSVEGKAAGNALKNQQYDNFFILHTKDQKIRFVNSPCKSFPLLPLRKAEAAWNV
jgi:hypothetical protein